MAKEEKLEEVKEPETSTESAPASAPVKKSGGALKVVLIVVGVLVLLIVAVLGYGFYNGSQIKKYAVDNEKMYNQTKKWDQKITDAKDAEDMKKEVDKVKSDAEKFLATVNGTAAPSKEAQLKSNLREFYTLSKKLADQMSDVIDWAVEIESASKDLGGLATIDSSSPQALTTSLEQAKAKVDATVTKMEKMDVPKSISTQHAAMLDAFKKLSVMYGKIITAVKNNDAAALSSIGTESSSITSALGGMEDTSKTIEKAYKDDVDRLDALDALIVADINKYKEVNFSF